MQMNGLPLSSHTHLLNLSPKTTYHPSIASPSRFSCGYNLFVLPPTLRISSIRIHRKRFVTSCIELNAKDGDDDAVLTTGEAEAVDDGNILEEDATTPGIWHQVKEIVLFSGPASGLWICGPLMSLITTAVVGQGSSTELAALGPGTVFCDNMNLLFMFLSIATSNLVATSLAKRDKKEVQHQISVLLSLGLGCGILMLLFTQFFGSWALAAFAGPKNVHLVSAASRYVQIRGLAWPAVLYGLVCQSASLGMKDSLGPLNSLLVATVVNVTGHLVLCSLFGYGIVGAAWATMASQVIAALMMIRALNKKGCNAFSITLPSIDEFLHVLSIAAPVFVTLLSKVAFYSLMTYFATSMGTFTVAAHQVMIQLYGMCMVWGEPLSQSAQSFMPELLYGVDRSCKKAKMMLKSLVAIGVVLGLIVASIGASIPWFFPIIFTRNPHVMQQMHRVLLLFFIALFFAPSTLSLEGTLLAKRDLKFMSLSMACCFCLGALSLLFVRIKGYGLPGCWSSLLLFQLARLILALGRILCPWPRGLLNMPNLEGKLKFS